MESNKNSNDNFQKIVNRHEKVISTEKFNYLYPNGHRMPHQLRWLKGSRDRGLKSNKVA